MKKLTLLTAALLSTGAFAAKPDTIGGSPKADFTANEMTIPCVLVEGLDDSTDGMFFDIKLLRRGNSFNYELVAAAAEDTAMCEAIADFAEMEDEDLVDEDDDDTTDDDTTDDDTTDDDTTDDDTTDDDTTDDDTTDDDTTDDDTTDDDTTDDDTTDDDTTP